MATVKTSSGRVLTEADIESIARRMEDGPAQLRGRRAGRPSLGDERLSPRIQLRVPPRLYATLSARARAEGKTVSAVVRELLEEHMQ